MADLSEQQFLIHIGYVLEAVKEVKGQMVIMNGRQRVTENKVAVLESQVEAASQTGSDRTARVTGIGGVLASAGALLWQWFSK